MKNSFIWAAIAALATIICAANVSLTTLPEGDLAGFGLLALTISIFPLQARKWNSVVRAVGATMVFMSLVPWYVQDDTSLMMTALPLVLTGALGFIALGPAAEWFGSGSILRRLPTATLLLFAIWAVIGIFAVVGPFGITWFMPDSMRTMVALSGTIPAFVCLMALPSKNAGNGSEHWLAYANLILLLAIFVTAVEYLAPSEG